MSKITKTLGTGVRLKHHDLSRLGRGAMHMRNNAALLLLLGLLAVANYYRTISPSQTNTNVTDPPITGKLVNVHMGSKANDTGVDTNVKFKLARDQSFGFFYDISEDRWNRLRQIYMKNKNHFDPRRPYYFSPFDPAPMGNSDPAWYQNNYEPNFSCESEMRIGKNMNGDGPKWVCDPHRIRKLAATRKQQDPSHPGCVIYSVGSQGDFNFEVGMQNEVGKGVCEFHIFDPGNYGHMIPPELERAHYHRWGLAKQKANEGSSASANCPSSKMGGNNYCGLRDTIKQLGHDKLDAIDIFKIDCEGCEWETFHDWFADDIPLLQQIQVEVHRVQKGTTVDFFDTTQAAGYLTYHKEPNIQFGSNCIEYGFVKVDKSFIEGKNFAV